MEKILKIFKRFAGNQIDLHGLKCIPIRIGELTTPHPSIQEFYPIEFKIENPDDVSYFYSIVEDDLFDVVEEFSDYVNLKIEPNLILDGKPEYYLNGEVKKRIQKVFDSVKEIKFTSGTPFVGYQRYVIKIESIGMTQSNYDRDSYSIANRVVPISATKNGENIDIETALKEYDMFLKNKDTYYETEEYYRSIDDIINDYPLLSNHHVATYYDTKFIV